MIWQRFRRYGIDLGDEDLGDEAGVAREEARVRREFWPKFRRFAAQLPFAEYLVAAYFCAFDRNTPRRVQVALIGALAYFVLPFDFIPDMLPLIGFADDAAVLATAIRLVSAHITPQHRDAARRAVARAAAQPGFDESGLDESGFGARSFDARSW
jgi:uncharacterized membrane protein YkvA (DUF1232 family)